jgi:hypothetical protein
VNPKFDDPLYFRKDANGERFLEACGPINFGPGDLMAEITKIEIKDSKGTSKPFDVNIFVGARDTMWEADLTHPDNLQPGPGAGGTGTATVTRRTGEKRAIQWTGTFELTGPA